MPVMEAARATAIECDGADSGMRVKQLGDRIRHFGTDRRVGARNALSAADDIPQRYAAVAQEPNPLVIARWHGSAKQRENDWPEQVARMGVVLLPAQRLLAGQGPQHEHERARVDERWKAALGSRRCLDFGQSTKRPRRTAVCPRTSRRDGMISTQLS